MKHMCVNEKWLGWMKNIFFMGKSSVLLNEAPGHQFHHKRGVWQGDPVSPLIFVLVADLLQAAINDAFSRDMIKLPSPCLSQKDYQVIQYTDDTMFLGCPHVKDKPL